VSEERNEGADKELPCVNVAQDLDPSPEGPKDNLAIEGKPGIINPDFEICVIIVAMIVHLRFSS
jgi:hypothetical protein